MIPSRPPSPGCILCSSSSECSPENGNSPNAFLASTYSSDTPTNRLSSSKQRKQPLSAPSSVPKGSGSPPAARDSSTTGLRSCKEGRSSPSPTSMATRLGKKKPKSVPTWESSSPTIWKGLPPRRTAPPTSTSPTSSSAGNTNGWAPSDQAKSSRFLRKSCQPIRSSSKSRNTSPVFRTFS